MLRHACFFATCLALQGGAVVTGARADTIGADPSDYATRIHVKAEELGFIQDYDTAPRAARFATPVYPDQALEHCVAGTVMVLIGIDDHGRVVESEVLESIPELDDAALDCVRKWRFIPAEKDGRPVGTVALAPVSFEPPLDQERQIAGAEFSPGESRPSRASRRTRACTQTRR